VSSPSVILTCPHLIFYSEKARIPAWTDRILRKGSRLRQTSYGSAPLRFSDHRPVYATFQCIVSIIDAAIRESLSREIYAKRRADVGNTVASARTDDTDDEDIIGYEPIEPGLPPASSDHRKWWLDNSLPARSSVQPPQRGTVPNPTRPTNPFTVTDEPDWVTVSKPSRAESFQSTASSISTSDSRAPSVTQRKLPPQFDPSTLPTSNTNRISVTKNSSVAGTPANQDSRRPSSAASINSISKKPAPPVAKKPVHLTSSPSTSPKVGQGQNGRPNSMTMPPRSMIGVQTEFPPPPRRVNTAAAGHDGFGIGGAQTPPPPPPQPRRSGTGMVARDSTPTAAKGLGDGGLGPKLPSRAAAAPHMDLLGDGDEGNLKGWEVLKPTT
jgi:hypothetical protein